MRYIQEKKHIFWTFPWKNFAKQKKDSTFASAFPKQGLQSKQLTHFIHLCT